MQVVGPFHLSVLGLSWELKHLLSSLEVSDDSSVIFSAADNQAWVGQAPIEGQDTRVMDIVKSSNWVVWVSKIPDAN